MSEKNTDCGPVVLKMVLEYFGENHSIEEISRLEKRLESGLVWSSGIALASKKLGFPVRFASITNFIPEDIEYYINYNQQQRVATIKICFCLNFLFNISL